MAGTIIYLHGFLSVGNSEKARTLRAAFPHQTHLAPDLTFDPDENLKIISELLATVPKGPVIFVGTSLGGFWAHYFAQTTANPCVIVNPCIHPSHTFKDRCGDYPNYVTGEKVSVTPQALARYRDLERDLEAIYDPKRVHLLLAQDDDVLPYAPALTVFEGCSTLVVTESGGHRFTTEWQRAIDVLKRLCAHLC